MRHVAEESLLHYLEDTENLWLFVAAISQSSIPANRRRKIQGKASLNADFIRIFKKVRQEYFENLAFQLEINIEPEPEAKQEIPQETPTELPTDLLQRFSTEAILAEVGRRMSTALAVLPQLLDSKIIHGKIIPGMANTPIPEKTVSTVQKKILPRVMLVEFLSQQEQAIERKVREAGIEVDLIFGGKGRRESVPTSCNYCIFFEKTNHSLSSRLKKQLGKERIFKAVSYTHLTLPTKA